MAKERGAESSLVDALRTSTEDRHAAIQRLPAFAALASGALPPALHAELLCAMVIVLRELARTASEAAPEDAAFARLARDTSVRVAVVERELARVGAREGAERADSAEAVVCAYALADEMRRRAHGGRAALFGYAYVLDATAVGTRLAGTSERAPAFGAATKEMRAHAVAGACAALDGLARVVAALGAPERLAVGRAARALNHEAGSHAITGELVEIEAALRAGERTWNRFRYYERRYGERGRRFTRSDSAWLVTLCDVPFVHAERHVRWLGEVLSSRGMPLWLLEVHLGHLEHELVRALPSRAARYAQLAALSDALRATRVAVMDDARLAMFSAAFDAQVPSELARQLPEAGALVAAAAADELGPARVRDAVASLTRWLADPLHFPRAWCDAVHDVVRDARDAANAANAAHAPHD